MKIYTGIAITSGVVDKVYTPPSTLAKSLESEFINSKEKIYRGLPSCLSHDHTKLAGWSQFTHIVLNDKAYLHFRLNIPETKEENKQIHILTKHSIFDRLEKNPDTDKLRQILENKKLLMDDSYFTEASMIPSFYKADIVKMIMQDLPLDNLNMIDYGYLIENFEHCNSGCFRHKETGLVIFSDRHFKKSSHYMNSNNLYFFREFDVFYNANKNNLTKILLKIDTNLIAYASELKNSIECEYWWGVHFSNDFSKLPTGVTVHAMRAEDGGKIFEDIEKTEFYWYDDEAVNGHQTKALQIEEIKSHPIAIDDEEKSYVFKYLHSYVDKIDNIIIHCDGSVRIYDDSLYEQRINTTIDKTDKDATYVKLFRIDGKIQVEDWKRLVNSYFMNNHLIMEYFENNSANPRKVVGKNAEVASDKDINVRISFEENPILNSSRMVIEASEQLESFFNKSIELSKSVESDCLLVTITIKNSKIIYFLDFYGKGRKVSSLLERAKQYIKFESLPSEYVDSLQEDVESLL